MNGVSRCRGRGPVEGGPPDQSLPGLRPLLRLALAVAFELGERAADDVASALADIALRPPANGMLEVAGPESLSIADFVGRYLAASGDKRKVVADPEAGYFGAALDGRGLNPGDGAIIGPTRFDDWFARTGTASVAPVR
jgi:uncharacterized protein YbjT (DUF2867 family)